MIDEEKLAIEFFKNGSAQRVLGRFAFSEEEKKLVEDAIRTAQRTNPRMKVIYEADAFLKEVVKTRKPIMQEQQNKISEESIERIKAMNLNTHIRTEFPIERTFFGFKSKYGVIAVIVIALLMIAMQYFINKSINDRMEQMNASSHEKIIF